MGYPGLKVQPFEIFRDAYYYAGGYAHNWMLRRIVTRYMHDQIDQVLLRLYELGWRATCWDFDSIHFANGYADDEPDSDVSDVSETDSEVEGVDLNQLNI